MEVKPQEAGFGDGVAVDEGPAPQRQEGLWDALGVLYQRRGFIAKVTGVTLVLSVVVALLIPKWYMSEARVLQPEGGGLGSLLGLVGRASGGLSSLLGGKSGDYARYLTILTSRSMMEAVVEEFDLVRVYGLEGKKHPTVKAVEQLEDNVEFDVALDYDYLAVRAFDKDPERAAAMANFMVARLNEHHVRLSSETARQTRLVVEQRLRRAELELDSVRTALQTFQETSGVVELESQAQVLMESVASLKAEAARLEVRYQTLARQYGPDNPQVQAAREALASAQSQVARVLGGRDALLPIAMADLPATSRRYAELMQGLLVQREVMETIYPLYEQALFQEQSAMEAVQVIDEAVPPVRAARPSRRLIVIGAVLTGLLLACGFVLLQAWLRRNASVIAGRLNRVRQAPA